MPTALEFLARLVGLKSGDERTNERIVANQDKERLDFLRWFEALSDADQARALEVARRKAAKSGGTQIE